MKKVYTLGMNVLNDELPLQRAKINEGINKGAMAQSLHTKIGPASRKIKIKTRRENKTFQRAVMD